jgi:hypothetical protein
VNHFINASMEEQFRRDQTRLKGRNSSKDDSNPHERAIVRFAIFQIFVVVYLNKFALGPLSFQLSVPMLFFLFGMCWMLLHRHIEFSPLRLGLYLIFVGCCIISQLLANTSAISLPSILQLLMIYWFMTISAPLSEAAYSRVLKSFQKQMIVPALIGLTQYLIQIVSPGHGDPISMTPLVPKSFLMQGYWYEAHYPTFTDPFQRPNGFFFLEPSFYSFFTAVAVIIEVAIFRRPFYVILMVAATLLSTGATGFTMLIAAAPMLLLKESPKIIVAMVVITVISLLAALVLGIHLPLISRMDELETAGVVGGAGSGGVRLVVPFKLLIEYLSDPTYFFTGSGAGSTTAKFGSVSPWPILKLTYEYGVITMIAYCLLFASAVFTSTRNLPLKIIVMIVFQFTGGYLVDTITVQLFVILFCFEPIRNNNYTQSIALKGR